MYRDRDVDPGEPAAWSADALIQDLEMDVLFRAMAGEDVFLLEAARKAILASASNDLDTIRYRQAVLRDCLKNAAVVREIYDLAVEAIVREKKNFWSYFSKYPAAVLSRAVDVLQMLVGMLKKLRQIADVHGDRFESEGFATLFAMLKQELCDDYFALLEEHLRTLRFKDGVLISAAIGKGNKGEAYILRKPAQESRSWLERIFGRKQPACLIRIADRDENGFRALSELRDRGVNLVANALAQSDDHILGFFQLLRSELAFYVGCVNLHEQLTRLGAPACFPTPAACEEGRRSAKGLYDVCLALTMARPLVGNDLGVDRKTLVMITGANQGGKSTFLRSLGVSQLMMQCGMFVPAESFDGSLCGGVFTHFTREEDATMKSGKLDEELARMSGIVDHLAPRSLLLFNESFSATNEREGSEIARQIVGALLERRMTVCFVTHLYEFAHGMYETHRDQGVFLRAERAPSGERTFRILEGEPLHTSYGQDVYAQVFGDNA